MTSASPRISLIVATYNWPRALALVLASVRAQRVRPFELIVADDGSRDDTRELIERAGELVGWSHTSFRHNYAHLLSSFLSAREPVNLPERLREMHVRRLAREPLAPTYCVVIVNANVATHARLARCACRRTERGRGARWWRKRRQ